MKTKKLKFGVIADPIGTFDPEAETTFFLMKEITNRGHESWVMEMKDLYVILNIVANPPSLRGGSFAHAQDDNWADIYAHARRIRVIRKKKIFSHEILEKKTISLASLGCIFLRKDPPVDMEYVNHLTILEMLERPHRLNPPQPPFFKGGGSHFPPLKKGGKGGFFPSPLFINSPSGIKKANEKIYPFHFPGVSPPSVVSQSPEVLLSFLKKIKKGVVKPLNAGGGKGILLVNHGDRDAKSLLDVATHNFTQYVLLQKYIPEARRGDKRILLLNGEPLGSFLRVPSRDDFRGNLHSGARFVKSPLTSAEKKVIERLKPALRRDGLPFVGLDLIGPYVTEINTTSPMGIREINQLDNSQIEKNILNFIEARFLISRVPVCRLSESG